MVLRTPVAEVVETMEMEADLGMEAFFVVPDLTFLFLDGKEAGRLILRLATPPAPPPMCPEEEEEEDDDVEALLLVLVLPPALAF